jgi:methionine aminopeptidase
VPAKRFRGQALACAIKLACAISAANGWALKTVDGTRAAHAEHTVAITKDGPRILTLP